MVYLYWTLILIMFIGVAGAIIPGLPGAGLILSAVLIWGFVHGWAGLTWAVSVAIAVFALSTIIDILATYVGAKQAGASNWGQIGCMVGLFLGVFGLLPALPFGGPIIGMFIGPTLGAFIGEFLYRRDVALRERAILSGKATLGILVGTIVGRIIQTVLALVAVIIFIVDSWPPVVG